MRDDKNEVWVAIGWKFWIGVWVSIVLWQADYWTYFVVEVMSCTIK